MTSPRFKQIDIDYLQAQLKAGAWILIAPDGRVYIQHEPIVLSLISDREARGIRHHPLRHDLDLSNPSMRPIKALTERECCGTFPGTPHRSTCDNYRGKR